MARACSIDSIEEPEPDQSKDESEDVDVVSESSFCLLSVPVSEASVCSAADSDAAPAAEGGVPYGVPSLCSFLT